MINFPITLFCRTIHRFHGKEVKGIRDILSHHYFDMDAEIIYNVSKNEIQKLIDIVSKIILDIK